MTRNRLRKSVAPLSVLLIVAMMITLAGCGGSTNKDNASSSSGKSSDQASNGADANNADKSGASGGSSGDTSNTGATDSGNGAAADTSEFVKLTWYMPPPLDPRPNEANVMKYINDILKEKINASVEFKFVDWATYAQKIKVASAAGEEFDIFSDLNQIGFSPIVSSGMPLELDDLINKYGQDIVKKVPNQAWTAVTTKGKKYGIANPSAWVTSYNIAFRKDIADKYNIDYGSIHSYQELEPVLQMLKEKEPDLIPFVGTFALPQTMDSISPMIGYDTTDGKWKSGLDNQAWLDTLKIQHDWYVKGYSAKKVVTDALAEFKSGRYAVSTYHVYDSSFVKTSTDFGTPMVATPLNLKSVVTGASVRSVVNYISKTSKHPERAMMLLNLLYADKDVFNKLCYGVEGDDWNYVSGKGTDNPTVKTKDQLGWAVWHPWIGSLWDQWPSNWNSQEVLDGLKNAIDKADYSPFVGFVFDSAPVKKEMAQIDAMAPELQTLFMANDYEAKIAQYKEKLNKAGLDKVLAEIQRQVDAWKAANGK